VTSPRSVEVTWNLFPSSNLNVAGYLIRYGTIAFNTDGGEVLVPGRNTTSVNLTNLEEDTSYLIAVQYISSDGVIHTMNRVSTSVITWTDGKKYVLVQ